MAKEKAKVVKETKSTQILSVPAYSDNNLVGWTQVTTFKETEDGLNKAKQDLTLQDVINVNRQRITDAKNNLRRGTSVMATLKNLAKSNPAIEQLIADLVKRAESGTLDDNYLKSIGA